VRDFERRARDAQRHAVARELPEENDGSILRMADGQVLLYDEQDEKRRPVTLRAIVFPDGETVEVETDRFRPA